MRTTSREWALPVLSLLLLLHHTAPVQGGKVPSSPRNFKAELIAADKVRLSWEAPTLPNGQLRGYFVYKEQLENGLPVSDMQKAMEINDPKKLYAVLEELDPNREYSFRVNAHNKNGDGDYSESRIIVTGGKPPKQPDIIGVSLLPHANEATMKGRVEWRSVTSRPLESGIDRYHIWYRAQGKSEFHHVETPGSAHEAILPGLWMGQHYDILVGAENVEGMSPNASEILATPTGIPDGEPVNVQYEIVDGKMRLLWDPPREEKRNGNITSFKAILTPMDSDGERIEKEVKTNQAIFAVKPHLSYTFKVSASTMKGSGPFSPILTINPNPDGNFYSHN